MRISDWSSDVCSSDLVQHERDRDYRQLQGAPCGDAEHALDAGGDLDGAEAQRGGHADRGGHDRQYVDDATWPAAMAGAAQRLQDVAAQPAPPAGVRDTCPPTPDQRPPPPRPQPRSAAT